MEYVEPTGNYSIKPRLVDLINGMTEEQCERLFKHLQATEYEDEQNEWDPNYVKKHPRRDFFMVKRVDRRFMSRVDCKCPVYLEGLSKQMTITNLCLGGVFIKCDSVSRNKYSPGDLIQLKIQFPTEPDTIQVPAQVVNNTDQGLNCQFAYLDSKMEAAIYNCYNTTKHPTHTN